MSLKGISNSLYCGGSISSNNCWEKLIMSTDLKVYSLSMYSVRFYRLRQIPTPLYPKLINKSEAYLHSTARETILKNFKEGELLVALIRWRKNGGLYCWRTTYKQAAEFFRVSLILHVIRRVLKAHNALYFILRVPYA